MRAAALLLLACSLAPAQTYTIAGIVKNPGGRPAKRVRVAISRQDSGESQTAMFTGEDGRFRFDALTAGKYHLTAETPAGIGQTYGALSRAAGGFGSSVVTGPGYRTDNLVFQLLATCSIGGRVLDGDGEPAENVLVQLFASRLVRGKRTVLYWGYRYTDDRGDYHFGNLADGTYYVAAGGAPWYVNRVPAGGALSQMGFGTRFYPNAPDPRQAGALRVKPGQELTADFTLLAAPAARLTVTMTGVPNGTPVQLDLSFEGVAGSKCWEKVVTGYPPQPAEFLGIRPGTYTLRARGGAGGTNVFGSQRVTVGAGETSAAVALAPVPAISGKLWLEDASSVPEKAFIQLENEIENIHVRRPLAKDGTFQFDSLPPGQYRPMIDSPHQRIRLCSVTVDGVMAKEEMVDISGNAKLELLGLLSGGKVNGTVTRRGEAAPGVLALLAPRKESLNPLDYSAFLTDSDGSFEFQGLPAGDYVLMAIEDWTDLEYANPAIVRPYLEAGRALRLESGKTEKIQLDLK